jgi:hypothetical protein
LREEVSQHYYTLNPNLAIAAYFFKEILLLGEYFSVLSEDET